MRTLSILLLSAPAAFAQTSITQVPLNYNFNGMVHANEGGQPDDPNGYRSISDRALNFSGGVPGDALLDKYIIVNQAQALDIVHLGNRNTVSGGLWAFEAVADGDNIGTQPAWLTTVDQSTPQTTTLSSSIALTGTSELSCIFQISDGGGSFDVVVDFASGAQATATLSGGDWFAGAYAGCDSVDFANFGATLHIMEDTMDLSAFSGESVTAISFANPSNANAGYAILAANVSTGFVPQPTTPITLNYNFNGMVHTGEGGLPDNLFGYRSISDRGLDFQGGFPPNTVLDLYSVVEQANALDIVHLGNRLTVAGGAHPFDGVANGDCLGIQPSWLTNPDQSGPQTTTLSTPLTLTNNCSLDVLFQISNGGGSFDVTCDFASGASTTGTVSGGDWFNGQFAGTAGIDCANADNNLNVVEGSVDLGAFSGETLTAITFSNSSNADAGVAILAANLVGVGDFGNTFCFGDGSGTLCPCGNASSAGVGCANGSGLGGRLISSGSASVSAANLVLEGSQLIGSQPGLYFQGNNAVNGGAGVQFGDGLRCAGGGVIRLQVRFAGSGGSSATTIDIAAKGGCAAGDVKRYQVWYRDPLTSPCGAQFNLTNGVEITWIP